MHFHFALGPARYVADFGRCGIGSWNIKVGRSFKISLPKPLILLIFNVFLLKYI